MSVVVPTQPGVPLNPGNCPSTHGVEGFMAGTVFDVSLGCYVCPCGRQYLSQLDKPDEITLTKSFVNPVGVQFNKDGKPKKQNQDPLAQL